MKLPKVLATLMGVLIAGIGIVGIALPSVLLEVGQSLQTQGALYVVAAVRIVLAAVLIWAASASRMPRTLRVIGIIIIVAAFLALLFGVERSQAMLSWFSSQGPLFMRAWASVAVLFGVFIVYAVNTPRRAAA
jgi:hypothetical protein